MTRPRILIAMSGADYIKLANGKEAATGFFLKELGQPLIHLLEAGYDVVFANPTGEKPALDPLSDNSIWFFPRLGEREREKQLLDQMSVEKNFSAPLRFADISDDDLNSFAGVFIPGGHAPMTDLLHDKDLGRILMHFHSRRKPTATLCHGPAALLSTKLVAGGAFPYQGYHMTCYSNIEETMTETMLGGKVSPKLASLLEESGVQLQENLPMLPKVTEFEELLTAQGPTSADALGRAFVAKLQTAAH